MWEFAPLIKLAFLGIGAVSADETVSTSEQSLRKHLSAATEDVNHLGEASVYTADAALPTADPKIGHRRVTLVGQSWPSTEASSTTTDTPAAQDWKPKATAEKVADLPTNEEKQLRPKEAKFELPDDLLKRGTRKTSGMNRKQVLPMSRFQGKQIMNKPTLVRSKLSAMNSKAKDHASVGGEEFKAYAFDYRAIWLMVFWEGLVPSADDRCCPLKWGSYLWNTLYN